MELGTFGAILRFALEMEQQAAAFYEATAPAGLEEAWQELARRSRQRLKRLERARREGVQEMILEPIRGLDSNAFLVEVDPEADEAGLRLLTVALEERAHRFYRDAAAKLPIRGVARLFQRMAQESEQCKQQLEK